MNKLKIAALAAVGAGILAASFAFAQADPITASCSGVVSGNDVTWNASATGGTAPYTFLWSGDPSVAGNTASSVTVTYAQPGTINVGIQADDVTGIVGTSTCSATVGAASTSTTPTAGLSLTAQVSTTTPAEGDVIDYGLTVTALGPSTSTGVVVSDVLPSGLTFLDSSSSMGTYASSMGTWTVGDMAPSSSAMLEIAAGVNSGTAGQTIVDTATAGESTAVVNPSTATSSAASITVMPAATTTSAPTSTASTTPVAPLQLFSIDPNGNFRAQGMIVTDAASSSFAGQIWGITYTVHWTGSMTPVVVGQPVDVVGTVSSTSPFDVNATAVAAYTTPTSTNPGGPYPGGGSGGGGYPYPGGGGYGGGGQPPGGTTSIQARLAAIVARLAALEAELQRMGHR